MHLLSPLPASEPTEIVISPGIWSLPAGLLILSFFLFLFLLFFTHKNKILIDKDGIRVASLRTMTS